MASRFRDFDLTIPDGVTGPDRGVTVLLRRSVEMGRGARFNIFSLVHSGANLDVWDVGGNEARARPLFRHYLPWAFKAARRCDHLMSIEYERYFDKDLVECREEWGVVVCPKRKAFLTSEKR